MIIMSKNSTLFTPVKPLKSYLLGLKLVRIRRKINSNDRGRLIWVAASELNNPD